MPKNITPILSKYNSVFLLIFLSTFLSLHLCFHLLSPTPHALWCHQPMTQSLTLASSAPHALFRFPPSPPAALRAAPRYWQGASSALRGPLTYSALPSFPTPQQLASATLAVLPPPPHPTLLFTWVPTSLHSAPGNIGSSGGNICHTPEIFQWRSPKIISKKASNKENLTHLAIEPPCHAAVACNLLSLHLFLLLCW